MVRLSRGAGRVRAAWLLTWWWWETSCLLLPFLQTRKERHFLKAGEPDGSWAAFQLWRSLALTSIHGMCAAILDHTGSSVKVLSFLLAVCPGKVGLRVKAAPASVVLVARLERPGPFAFLCCRPSHFLWASSWSSAASPASEHSSSSGGTCPVRDPLSTNHSFF